MSLYSTNTHSGDSTIFFDDGIAISWQDTSRRLPGSRRCEGLRTGALQVRMSAIVLLAAIAVSACSGDSGWERLPLGELAVQAESAAPAAWALDPPEGWPIAVPAPSFLENRSDSALTRAGGERTSEISTREQPSESDVVAYISLLFKEGFEIDDVAAAPGWLVRDGVEWVVLTNLATDDYLSGGDLSQPDPFSGGFQVRWTTNPVSVTGYCRVLEVGGLTCRS